MLLAPASFLATPLKAELKQASISSHPGGTQWRSQKPFNPYI
jgi:hypothetical protein